ncbi:MAG: NAD(P)H-binding protein [Bacteroidales bacterium]|nr:NAD(P)H-binding protein [Bacteroidales bacterium]MCF8458700.1 NAD(P)H-binding protein [Bacteroidales bacterium]
MKIAITTASGQLGSAIIKSLVSEIGNENVIGIARTPSKAIHLNIEIRKGDYNSKADFDTALQGVDVVLLVSGMDAPDHRIGQHCNVINAAKEAGVRKIVYTSIIGKEGSSSFDAIVQSNRQTEKDIQESGLEWAIGRNGLYIEPDVEYIEQYQKDGKIANCASTGLCSYTTRAELAFAYTQMTLNDNRNGKIFNLAGGAISQQQLTNYLNQAFATHLFYEEMSQEDYLAFQQKANGEFLGTIIAGIYTKIRNGEFHIDSNFKEAAGRNHIAWDEYFRDLKS